MRFAAFTFIIVVLGSALFLCATKIEAAALIWRLYRGDLSAGVKLQSLPSPAQEDVQKYCRLILFPALDSGTPDTFSRLFALGQSGQTAFNNYFAKVLSETQIKIPDSSSLNLDQSLPQDTKHIFFLSKYGELEASGEAFAPNAISAGKSVLFADAETPFQYLLPLLETLAKERSRTVFFAAQTSDSFSFAKVELTTPSLIHTLFPNTVVALSDENSFFNHANTQDTAAFTEAIDRARKESPSPNFFVRFVVAENVAFDSLFKLVTFCLENNTRPLFKLLTDEDALILDDEAKLQGLNQ